LPRRPRRRGDGRGAARRAARARPRRDPGRDGAGAGDAAAAGDGGGADAAGRRVRAQPQPMAARPHREREPVAAARAGHDGRSPDRGRQLADPARQPAHRRRPRRPGDGGRMTAHRTLRVPIGVGTALVLAVGLGTPAAGSGPGAADPARAVTGWAGRHADPVASTDPAAPLRDLAPLRRSIGDARIVALGEAPHGAAEETTLKHRTLRLLVERLGVRTVAWEEDWTTGVEIDRYIHGGPQDLDRLTARMSPQYQTAEVAAVLAWLRRFNAGRRDTVSFFGVEYY